MAKSQANQSWRNVLRWTALAAGPLLAVVVYVALDASGARFTPSANHADSEGADELVDTPEGTPDIQFRDHAGRMAAALAVWMAVWWMTEAIPVYATALLPLAVLPLGRALPIENVAAQYAHPLIFLFMGGFMLALAMERWGLHRRIALGALRMVGTRPAMIVGGFMVVTAALSMWVSNTATSVMMLPIALSLIEIFEESDKDSPGGRRFAVCLLLGIAYAASIGGVGTIIGSPPNLFVVSYMRQSLNINVTFLQWMAIGVPITLVFLPIAWFLLTWLLYPIAGMPPLPGGAQRLREAASKLGPAKPGEWVVLVVFCLTAAAWISKRYLTSIEVGGVKPLAGLENDGDSIIAMVASLALFIIPVDAAGKQRVLNWEWAVKLPWGVLLLFGGGLSLAHAMDATHVSAYIGGKASLFAGLPGWLLVLLVVAVVIFLTELTSNLATTAALVPVLAAVSGGLGVDAVILIVPAALAASCAFMLPVATPPNAVVFGTGRLTIMQMARAGLMLNLVGIVLITLAAYALILPLLGRG